MNRKLIVAFTGLMLLAGVGACSPVRVTDPAPPACETNERYLQVDIDTMRWPMPGGPGAKRYEPGNAVDITFAAVSLDPDFGGVDLSGIFVKSENHDVLQRVAPFSEAACWPIETPVAFLVRAWARNPMLDDELNCYLTDKHDTHGFPGNVKHENDHIGFEDMHRDLYVECIDYYLPPGWDGPDLPRFPPPNQ